MSGATDPVDKTHRQSLNARETINEAFQALKEEAAKWEPRPYKSPS